MQKQPPSSFCAVAAIAAALALGSTAVQAQDAGPAPNVPTVAPPPPAVAAPASAPTAPSAQISTPVVQAVPATAAPEPASQRAPAQRAAEARAAPRSQAATARPAARTAAPRATPPVETSVPAVAAVPPATAVPPPAVAPAPTAALDPAPPVSPAPATRAQPQSDGLTGAEAGLIALLAAGGLAGAGFVVARSRRRRDQDEIVETEAIADRPVAAPPAPVVTPEPVVERQPEPVAERFAMPAGEVPTGAAREELLQRMVAAAPDEANPFTSPRARRKRARLILQHRAHLQRTQGTQAFDWRTYRPSHAAARVDEPA